MDIVDNLQQKLVTCMNLIRIQLAFNRVSWLLLSVKQHKLVSQTSVFEGGFAFSPYRGIDGKWEGSNPSSNYVQKSVE